MIEDFLKDMSYKKSKSTVESYRISANQFSDFVDRNDISPDSDAIDEWVKYMIDSGYSDGTIRSKFYDISVFFGWMVDNDIIDKNEAKDVSISDYVSKKLTKKKKLMKDKGLYLKKDEYDALLKNVPSPSSRNELIFKIMYQTGLRPGEVVDIKLDDIDYDSQKIYIYAEKTHENRKVWMGQNLTNEIKVYVEVERDSHNMSSKSDYLFFSTHHPRLNTNSINKIVRAACKNAGLTDVVFEDKNGGKRRRITPHTFRHGFAVGFLKANKDIRVLQKILGHEKLETTAEYLDYVDEDLAKDMREYGNSFD